MLERCSVLSLDSTGTSCGLSKGNSPYGHWASQKAADWFNAASSSSGLAVPEVKAIGSLRRAIDLALEETDQGLAETDRVVQVFATVATVHGARVRPRQVWQYGSVLPPETAIANPDAVDLSPGQTGVAKDRPL